MSLNPAEFKEALHSIGHGEQELTNTQRVVSVASEYLMRLRPAMAADFLSSRREHLRFFLFFEPL